VAPVVAKPAALPVINPTAIATTAAQSAAQIAGGGISLQIGQVSVPTLNGHSTMGYAYWSTLPLGYRFISSGHVYEVFNRVYLPAHGGVFPASDFGGALDLHTCTDIGSTLTWTRLVG
jgi:hypothetical protein